MNKQKGNMSLGMILYVFCFVVILVGVSICLSYVSAYDYGNSMENQLKAVQEENKNILAQYGQKVMEVSQVPMGYRNDLLKVTEAALQKRYGSDGSTAIFQMIKEHNPSLDPTLYKQVQQVMEAGRNDFQNGQTRQIDIRRQYETALGSFWKGTFLKFAGYPKLKLSDFDIVSTDRANSSFENKKESGYISIAPN